MPDTLPNKNSSSIEASSQEGLASATSSQKKLFVTIASAAKILGVSIDTIRRWDAQGILHSERLDGKNRYFLKTELKSFKKNRPLSISEAAIALSVSISTLRRLEKKGAVVADRALNGERLYSQQKIQEIVASRKKDRTQRSDIFSPSLLRVPEAQITGALNLSGQTLDTEKTEPTLQDFVEIETPKKSFWKKNYMLGRVGQFAAVGSPLGSSKKRVHFGNYAPEYKKGIVTFTFLLLVSSGIFAFTVLHDNPQKSQVLSAATPAGFEQLAKFTPQQRALMSQAVLAAATKKGQFTVNVPSVFNADITAPNIIYSVVAGQGISITPGQNPTISTTATGTDSFATVTAGGTSITAGSPTDTLAFTAGSNISLSGNSSSKTITISASIPSATNYWTLSGNNLYPTSTSYAVGIGNTSPSTTLDVTGTFNVSGASTFGSTTTLNGLTYTWPGTQSNTYILQTNGSGTLSWIDPGSLPSSNDFTVENGTIHPKNPTLDLLVGGSSSASAKFGFINVNSGTPAIQISGTTVLTGTTLGSGVVNSSLTSVGALASGSIASGFGTISTSNTITGTTLNGTTGINTGAGAGTQRIDSSGNLTNIGTTQLNTITYTWPGSQSSSYVLQTDGAGTLSWVSPSGSGFGTNYFTITGGAIYPTNTSLDFLVGGTSSAAAKFGLVNVNSGTPAIQISGTTVLTGTTLGSGVLASSLTSVGALTGGSIASGFGTIATANTITGTTLNGTTAINTGAGAGTTRIDVSGNLTNIGNISSTYLNASASTVNLASGTSLQSNGVTVIDASRNLTNIGTTQFNNITYTWPVTDAAAANYVLVSNALGSLSWINPGTLPNVNYFTISNGAIYPSNATLDLLVGGTSSASAKFGFINVNSGTPAIQISGTTVLTGTTLGSGVTTSSLTSVGALASGSIASGFGTIATANTITGTTLNGTTGVNTGAGAGTARISSGGNLTNIGTTQFNTITYTWPATQTASYVLQTDGAGGLSWANPAGAGFGTNYFSLGTGTIFPTNTSLDFLVGGASSSSARFAVLNVNSGTPIASLSAGTAGGAYLTASGTLQTTANQAITIGGDTTGNITLKPFNGTGGTVIIQGTTTLNGIAYTWPAADAAVSGYVLSSNAAGTLSWIAQTSGGTNLFTNASGLIYPINATEDFAIGGSSTASAKFAILNVNTGTPTASLSAGVAGGAYLTATGTLTTTAQQPITIGGATAGNITLTPLDTVNSTGDLNLSSGKVYKINNTSVLSATTLGTGVVTSSLTTVGALASGSIASGFGTIATANTITGTTLNGTTGINTGAGAGTNRIDVNGNLVNIGTISSTYLTTTTNVVNLAASTVLQSNSTTVLDASRNLTNIVNFTSSGTTSLNGVVYTWPAAATAGYVLTSGSTGATSTLSWADPGTFGINYWSLGTGTIYPTNTSLDLLLGSSASASARFAVLNVNSGTPTASLSAGAAGGAYLTATGNLQTTAFQTLSLGGSTTGDISITPGLGDTNTAGHKLVLTGGAGAATNAAGGAISIVGGAGAGTGAGGALVYTGGVGGATGNGGAINLTSGSAGATSGTSGAISLQTAAGVSAAGEGSGTGLILIATGAGGSATNGTGGTAGTISITGGAGGAATLAGGASGAGAPLILTAGAGGANVTNTSGAGGNISLTAGNAGTLTSTGTSGAAGTLILKSGSAGLGSAATGAAGGVISITAGNGSLALAGGAINLTSGTGGATGAGGVISLVTGAGGSTSGVSGVLTLATGTAASGAATGAVSVLSGNATAAASGALTVSTGTTTTSGTTGILTLSTGASAAASGAISIVSGTATTSSGSGLVAIRSGTSATGTTGAISILSGNATGAGTSGNVIIDVGTVAGGTLGTISVGATSATTVSIGNSGTTVLINSGTPATNGVAYSTDGNGTIAYTATGGAGTLCLTSASGAAPSFTSSCLTSSTGVTTAAGTANQILVNAGTSAVSGAITLTLPSAITAPGSLTTTTTLTATTDFTVNGNTLIGDATSDTVSIFPTTLAFAKENAHTIQIADSTTSNTAGGALTIKGAAGAATNAAGGAISVVGGAGAGTGAGGALVYTAGASGAGATGNGGGITLTGGAALSTNGTGGAISLVTGAGKGTGLSGAINIVSGTADSGTATGVVSLLSGNATAAASGALTVSTGTTTTSGTSGLLTLSTGAPGNSTSGATSGAISIFSAAGGTATTGTGGGSGVLTLKTGAGGDASGSGGAGGSAGAISIISGAGGAAGTGNAAGGAAGLISITAGNGGTGIGSGNGGAGGGIFLTAGNGNDSGTTGTSGAGGDIDITAGRSGSGSTGTGSTGAAGKVLITAGNAGNTSQTTSVVGGDVSITAGNGGQNQNGGQVVITTGANGNNATTGVLTLQTPAGNSVGDISIAVGAATNTKGNIKIGVGNAGGIFIGSSGVETTLGFSATTATEKVCGTQTNAGASTGIIRDCNGTPGDYAEEYGTTDLTLDKADIVAIDPSKQPENYVDREGHQGSKAWVVKSTSSNQQALIGIVSTEPNDVIGKNFKPEDNPHPVALSGRVPVKVSTENGPIHIGDEITSSSTPGIGMKAIQPGRVVGMAMQDYNGPDATNNGKIFVYVHSGWYLGENVAREITNPTMTGENFYNTDGSIKDQYKGQVLTSDQVDHMIKANIPSSQIATAFTFDANNNVGLGISTPSAKFDVAGGIKTGVVGQVAGAVTIAGATTGSATIKASQSGSNWTMTLPTDAGVNGSVLTTDGAGNTNWVDIASLTTPLRDEIFTTIGSATDAPTDSTIFGTLAKIQDQDIAGINDKLSVFTVATNSVTFVRNTIFDATATFNNGIEVLQDIVLSGRIKHKDQDTAGFAVIKNGDSEVSVIFDRPYETAPVINVTAQDSSSSAYVKNVTQNGFTVAMSASASADLKFSWNAVLVETPKTIESTSSAGLTPTVTPTPTP